MHIKGGWRRLRRKLAVPQSLSTRQSVCNQWNRCQSCATSSPFPYVVQVRSGKWRTMTALSVLMWSWEICCTLLAIGECCVLQILWPVFTTSCWHERWKHQRKAKTSFDQVLLFGLHSWIASRNETRRPSHRGGQFEFGWDGCGVGQRSKAIQCQIVALGFVWIRCSLWPILLQTYCIPVQVRGSLLHTAATNPSAVASSSSSSTSSSSSFSDSFDHYYFCFEATSNQPTASSVFQVLSSHSCPTWLLSSSTGTESNSENVATKAKTNAKAKAKAKAKANATVSACQHAGIAMFISLITPPPIAIAIPWHRMEIRNPARYWYRYGRSQTSAKKFSTFGCCWLHVCMYFI